MPCQIKCFSVLHHVVNDIASIMWLPTFTQPAGIQGYNIRKGGGVKLGYEMCGVINNFSCWDTYEYFGNNVRLAITWGCKSMPN